MISPPTIVVPQIRDMPRSSVETPSNLATVGVTSEDNKQTNKQTLDLVTVTVDIRANEKDWSETLLCARSPQDDYVSGICAI